MINSDDPNLKAWLVQGWKRGIRTAISDSERPGYCWLFRPNAPIVWLKWRDNWKSTPLPIDSELASRAIEAINTWMLTRDFRREDERKFQEQLHVRRLIETAHDEQQEQVVKRWQGENPRLYAAMLAVARSVSRNVLPNSQAVEELWNCELRIDDESVGLTANERNGFVGAMCSTLAMDTRLAIIDTIMDDSQGDFAARDGEAAWDAAEASVTWGMFVRELELERG